MQVCLISCAFFLFSFVGDADKLLHIPIEDSPEANISPFLRHLCHFIGKVHSFFIRSIFKAGSNWPVPRLQRGGGTPSTCLWLIVTHGAQQMPSQL